MRLMSNGNNVQRLDVVARICALYKNRVLLFLILLAIYIIQAVVTCFLKSFVLNIVTPE